MARRYKLRNGDIVEVAPGQDLEDTVGVVHDGLIKYLIKPDYQPGAMRELPKGGVYGEGFDAVAYDDPIDYEFNPFMHIAPPANDHLLDAIRYAAGFATPTQQGEVDLMNINEPAFTTKEYYHNTDVNTLSDDQIFQTVKNIDAKLKELGTLEGAAVDAHTDRLTEERTNLLRVVDARYPADPVE